MAEEYIALAFGRDNLRGRIYGAILPFNPEEDVVENREIYGRASEGVLDVRYQGSSFDEARKSIEGLEELCEEKLKILVRAINDEYLQGVRN